MGKPKSVNRVFRFNDLKRFTGRSKTQLKIDIRDGKFPFPVKLGKRSVGWFESDLLAWQQKLVRQPTSRAA